MKYSPKAGGMDLAVNAGLVRCMTDRSRYSCCGRSLTKQALTVHAIVSSDLDTWRTSILLQICSGFADSTLDEVSRGHWNSLSEESMC